MDVLELLNHYRLETLNDKEKVKPQLISKYKLVKIIQHNPQLHPLVHLVVSMKESILALQQLFLVEIRIFLSQLTMHPIMLQKRLP